MRSLSWVPMRLWRRLRRPSLGVRCSLSVVRCKGRIGHRAERIRVTARYALCAWRYANLAASRLDKDYLTSVKQVGMDVVEGLDLGHGGVEALGDKPE